MVEPAGPAERQGQSGQQVTRRRRQHRRWESSWLRPLPGACVARGSGVQPVDEKGVDVLIDIPCSTRSVGGIGTRGKLLYCYHLPATRHWAGCMTWDGFFGVWERRRLPASSRGFLGEGIQWFGRTWQSGSGLSTLSPWRRSLFMTFRRGEGRDCVSWALPGKWTHVWIPVLLVSCLASPIAGPESSKGGCGVLVCE